MRSRHPVSGRPFSLLTRLLLISGAAALLVGFGAARAVRPDPRGFGTHVQWGLPECAIRSLYSLPCPGCGMTTCFAHFVRGEFAEAAWANPAGLLLAVLCVLLIPWLVVSAFRGRMWMVEDPLPMLACGVGSIGLVALLNWAIMIWR